MKFKNLNMKPIPIDVAHCPVFKQRAKFCDNDENTCILYFSFGKYMQNQIVKSLIDELIGKFDDKSWIPPTHKKYNERWSFIPLRSRSNYKIYYWPKITFSEDGPEFMKADKNSDYLGYYDNSNQSIVTNSNTIEQCAEEFLKSSVAIEMETEIFPCGFEDWVRKSIKGCPLLF
jgi:hypothetical protein